jgi:hypothetical protein
MTDPLQDGTDQTAGPFNFLASYRSAYTNKIQLSPFQTQLIGAAIRSRAPGCRLLVFGAGYDTKLWMALNRDGHTHVLEASTDWLEVVRADNPGLSIELLPPHELNVASSLEMNIEAMRQHRPPSKLADQPWDVILIDGPRGYHPKDPGRAVYIAWASHLAGPATHIFVDDYERPLEAKFADGLLRGRTGAASYVIPASDSANHRRLFWSAGTPIEEQHKAVVLSIATEDYAQQWRFCIDSQHQYCRRHGYQYQLIDPAQSQLHPKWAKIEATERLLNKGLPVLLLDVDTEILKHTPPFTDLITADRDILVANGNSGRPNSGVMIFSASPGSVASAFVNDCLAARLSPVPAEDFVTKEGENGHVINLLRRPEYASRTFILDSKWNCSDPEFAANAYIKHYTNRLHPKRFANKDTASSSGPVSQRRWWSALREGIVKSRIRRIVDMSRIR